MAEPGKISAEEIRARLLRGGGADRDRWTEMAAVWLQFDPATLLLDGSPATARAQAVMLGDCVEIPQRDADDQPLPPLWTLRQVPRIAALNRLIRRGDGISQALAANPQEGARVENQLFSALLQGALPRMSGLPAARIQTVRDAIQTLRRLDDFPHRFDLDLVEQELAKEHLLAPFRALTASFVGREAELRALRSYVDVVASEGVIETAWRLVDRVTRSKRPAFAVYGCGGVGKSTLLAKFLLDHVRDRDLCFAYLDVERYELSEGRPEAITLAVLEQLRLFHPDHAPFLRQALNAAQVTPDTWWRSHTEDIGVDAVALCAALSEASRAKRDLHAALLGTVIARVAGASPALLVLDTFEVFQASGNFAARLSKFLAAVQDLVPLLRVVVCGRAAVPDLILAGSPPRELPLSDLGADAAVGLIQKRVGITEARARAVVQQVGSNPLTLTLACRLIEADPTTDLTAGARIWDKLDAARMQGFLYTRVLGRISDDRVRRVSHPGLVLRRLNRDVLRGVLDGPCKLALSDDADADGLLAALRAEVSLLSVDTDGGLRFRSDLRVLAVPLLAREQPALVNTIHENAARYYGPRPDPTSQAEHLYHLLAIGDLKRAEAVSADVDLRIGAEIELLPAASQAWVRSHHLNQSRVGASQVAEMIDKGDFEAVVMAAATNPRIEREAPVPLAQALYWTGRDDEARAVASRAVVTGVGSEDLNRLLALIGKQHDGDAYRQSSDRAVDTLADFLGESLSLHDVKQVFAASRGPKMSADVQQGGPRSSGWAMQPAQTREELKRLADDGLVDADFFGRLRSIVPARAAEIDGLEETWVTGSGPTSAS